MTMPRVPGGGRLTSDTEWGADDTFFSVTLYNFQKSGRSEALPASPPPQALASPRTLQTLCFRNLHSLSFEHELPGPGC